MGECNSLSYSKETQEKIQADIWIMYFYLGKRGWETVTSWKYFFIFQRIFLCITSVCKSRISVQFTWFHAAVVFSRHWWDSIKPYWSVMKCLNSTSCTVTRKHFDVLIDSVLSSEIYHLIWVIWFCHLSWFGVPDRIEIMNTICPNCTHVEIRNVFSFQLEIKLSFYCEGQCIWTELLHYLFLRCEYVSVA